MRGCLLFVLLVLSLTRVASAEDRVVLFGAAQARPGLCAALRIQLADIAEVTCREHPKLGGGLTERIAQASAVLHEHSAAIGVLLERHTSEHEVHMYVVGTRDDEAVLSVERVRDRPGPDVDRSLALKVRAAFEIAQEAPSEKVLQVLALAHPKVAPAPRPPRELTGWLELGGGVSLGTHTRSLGQVLLGVGGRGGRLSWETGLSVRMLERLESKSRKVSESEWAMGIEARLLKPLGRFELGAGAGLLALRSLASGVADDGTLGHKSQFLWAAQVLVDARVRLFSSLQLRLAPSLQVFSVAQRFSVDRHVELSLGRTQVVLPVSLVAQLPWNSVP